jgi:hypothetical protein
VSSVCASIPSGLESSLRSLNNLHEKLHHSTWWYLLINEQSFVTMSKYIYVVVLPMAGIFLWAMGRMGMAFLGLIQSAPLGRQRVAQSLGIVLAFYGLTATHYFSVGGFIALAGRGKWNQTAMEWWWYFVVGSWCSFFLVVWKLGSRTLQSTNPEEPSVVLLPLRYLAEQDALASAVAERRRENAQKGRKSTLLSRIAEKLFKKKQPKLQQSRSIPLGYELPLSPAGLPLLVPSQLSPSIPVPSYAASLDWRTLHSVLLLAFLACMVPMMVLNTSVAMLSLVFCVPLIVLASAQQMPGYWLPQLRALRDRQGRPINLGLAGNGVWQRLTYLVRTVLHFASLVLTSPPALVRLYAHFHSLSISDSSYDLLDSLARTPTNLLVVSFFFAYVPVYVGSILLLTCRFKLQPPMQMLSQEESGKSDRTKKEQ